MPTIPSLILGFIIASLYGTLFHLVRGGRPAHLFLYLGLSWFGFALGHIVGVWREWILFPIGPLDFGAATIGSILFLLLSLVNFRRPIKNEDGV